jgi:hypothetical protein
MALYNPVCFIDTMQPISPAETEGWGFYLNLHRDAWLPARAMFRAVHAGAAPSEVMLKFVQATGVNGRMAKQLEDILEALAGEARA